MNALNLAVEFLRGLLFFWINLCYAISMEVQMKGMNLTTVPNGINETVERLYLDQNFITRIDTFPKLPNLERLYISNNLLTQFPNILNVSDTLRGLNLVRNQIASIPKELLRGLNELRSLTMAHNRLTTFPEVALPELTGLNLGVNRFEECPKAIRLFPKLQSLTLVVNQISTCAPDLFLGLSEMYYLNIRSNMLDIFPQVPSSLEELKLGDNPIPKVTNKDLNQLKNLKNLHIDLKGPGLVPLPNLLLLPATLTSLWLPRLACQVPRLKVVNWMRGHMTVVSIRNAGNLMNGCFKFEDAKTQFIDNDQKISYDLFEQAKDDKPRKNTRMYADQTTLLPGPGERLTSTVMNELECSRICSRTPSCFLFGTLREDNKVTCQLTDGNLSQFGSNLTNYQLYI